MDLFDSSMGLRSNSYEEVLNTSQSSRTGALQFSVIPRIAFSQGVTLLEGI